MGELARRHHTVPRFYLDGFARGEHVGVVELPGARRFVTSTRNAATETDFYMLTDEDGVKTDVFEKALSDLEGKAAGVLRAIASGHWPLERGDRETLAEFVAVQHLRGPNLRRGMAQVQSAMAQAQLTFGGREAVAHLAAETYGREPTEAEVDKLWAEVTSDGGPPMVVDALQHIEMMGHALPESLPYFVMRPWYLVRFERRVLMTCDTPVALAPDPRGADDQDSAIGLATAAAITFPLTRDIGLMMMSPPSAAHVDQFRDDVARATLDGELDGVEPPTARLAVMFNALAVSNARRWLYHHPDDTHLVPEELPEPRVREMEISGTNFARE